MPKFITYPGMSGYYLLLPTTFRHQPMRSQLASQPANEEPAFFVHIFFWEICPYIFFENLSIYFLKICKYIFLKIWPYIIPTMAKIWDLWDLVYIRFACIFFRNLVDYHSGKCNEKPIFSNTSTIFSTFGKNIFVPLTSPQKYE